MNRQELTGHQYSYDKLAKVAAAGFVIQLIWFFIVSAITLGQSGRASSWVFLGITVLLIVFAFSKPFRRFLETEAGEPSLPVRVFIVNGLSLLLVGAFFLLLLDSSPHLLASVENASEAILEGGLLVLILLSLFANLVAYYSDRRAA